MTYYALKHGLRDDAQRQAATTALVKRLNQVLDELPRSNREIFLDLSKRQQLEQLITSTLIMLLEKGDILIFHLTSKRCL